MKVDVSARRLLVLEKTNQQPEVLKLLKANRVRVLMCFGEQVKVIALGASGDRWAKSLPKGVRLLPLGDDLKRYGRGLDQQAQKGLAILSHQYSKTYRQSKLRRPTRSLDSRWDEKQHPGSCEA